jgi:hypothetical protein
VTTIEEEDDIRQPLKGERALARLGRTADALYQKLIETSLALDSPIRGMTDRIASETSAALRASETEALAALENQKRLIDEQIAALEGAADGLTELFDTGWPEPPKVPLSEALMDELAREDTDHAASAQVFVNVPGAEIELTLDPPIAKG